MHGSVWFSGGVVYGAGSGSPGSRKRRFDDTVVSSGERHLRQESQGAVQLGVTRSKLRRIRQLRARRRIKRRQKRLIDGHVLKISAGIRTVRPNRRGGGYADNVINAVCAVVVISVDICVRVGAPRKPIAHVASVGSCIAHACRNHEPNVGFEPLPRRSLFGVEAFCLGILLCTHRLQRCFFGAGYMPRPLPGFVQRTGPRYTRAAVPGFYQRGSAPLPASGTVRPLPVPVEAAYH